MLDIRLITTLGMVIFHSACGLVEYCVPRVVINLDIQHSSVQYLLIFYEDGSWHLAMRVYPFFSIEKIMGLCSLTEEGTTIVRYSSTSENVLTIVLETICVKSSAMQLPVPYSN